MNCHGLESVINDLARDQMMDAATKARALAHAQVCRGCAARLADERMLTAGLRRLSADEAVEQAPARVEQMLRAAFVEQHSQAAPQVARTRRARSWAVAAGIAAIVVLAAIIALRFEKQSSPEQAGNKTQEAHPRTAAEEKRPEIANDRAPAEPPAKVQPSTQPKPDSLNDRPIPKRAKRTERAGRDERTGVQAINRPDLNQGINEIATDFMPIVQGESLNRMDGGQIVRVELPRSALVSFGLPMNMERADERIKADVVIGNDGLARAIRFVR
jgi:hypothetical protein